MLYYMLMRSDDGATGTELIGVHTSAERASEQIEASYAGESAEDFVLLRFEAERIELPDTNEENQ